MEAGLWFPWKTTRAWKEYGFGNKLDCLKTNMAFPGNLIFQNIIAVLLYILFELIPKLLMRVWKTA
jgi:hypothetical protein